MERKNIYFVKNALLCVMHVKLEDVKNALSLYVVIVVMICVIIVEIKRLIADVMVNVIVVM
jgi:hypothetical protein